MIETRSLSKRYRGGIMALEDLDLGTRHGTCVGFLGHDCADRTAAIEKPIVDHASDSSPASTGPSPLVTDISPGASPVPQV